VITPFKEKDFLNFQPEILITLGGMVVSKRVKTMLRTYRPEHHWHIDPLRAYNTYGSLAHHFEAHPNDFFNQILPFTKIVKSDYAQTAEQIIKAREIKHQKYLDKVVFSDLKVFEMALSSLPKQTILQLSNSSAIRYALLFDIDPSVAVFCNRGTSGIDGSTSTAIGAAVANSKQTTLITGDIGFLYDSNALWNQYIPKNFKIILINNGGGGIFRILPGHEENKIFNTFFETSHCLTAEHLAKMYGFEYTIASDVDSLKTGLDTLFTQNSKPVILEVFTPTKDNDKILLQYFKELA
jgi:2-succinyl-5-enolpyruvyl-6-hydroxy-3-cyclohexene-1-carboxylate synthase